MIIQGDCLEIMKSMPDKSFDCVITDPPYGLGQDKDQKRKAGYQGKNQKGIRKDYGYSDWDKLPNKQYFNEIMRVSKNQVIFGGNYFELPPSSCWLVWDKDNGNNDFADCELAWTSFTSAVRKIKHRWHGMLQQDMSQKEYRQHPTQKPVPVMRWIIENYTKKGDTILDPFMGSGTTLVASKQLGRNATGIEISEEYCNIARKRLQSIQKPLF